MVSLGLYKGYPLKYVISRLILIFVKNIDYILIWAVFKLRYVIKTNRFYKLNRVKNLFLKGLKKINELLAIRWVNNTLLILCGLIFLFSVWRIYVWYDENKKSASIQSDLIGDTGVDNNMGDKGLKTLPGDEYIDVDYTKVPYMTTDFSKLLQTNSQTVGWIRMNGTRINYPLVQATDNDYYLKHSFNKKESSAGWVFADFRNDMQRFDKNTIIYGHNRLDESMFGSLNYCLDKWWYENPSNHVVRLNTLYDQTVWEVFSVYVIPTENYYIKTQFTNNNDFLNFAKEMQARSQIKAFSKVTLNADDKILTFSTCKGINSTKRLVVHAKLIKSTHNKIPVSGSDNSQIYSSYPYSSYPFSSGISKSSSSSSKSGSSSSSKSSSGSGQSSSSKSGSSASSSKSGSSSSAASEASSKTESSAPEESKPESSKNESSEASSTAEESSPDSAPAG